MELAQYERAAGRDWWLVPPSARSTTNGTADELDWDILPRVSTTNTLPPPVSTKFSLNDTVQVATTTAVRASPSASGDAGLDRGDEYLRNYCNDDRGLCRRHSNWWLINFS